MKSILLVISVTLLTACAVRAQDSVPLESRFPTPVHLTAEQDHQRTMDILGMKTIRRGRDGSPDSPYAANYDESKANPFPILPDPLVLNDGTKVANARAWWSKRRPQLAELFDREIYGRVPKNVPKVTWELKSTKEGMNGDVAIVTKTLVGHVDNSSCPLVTVDIQLELTTPAKAAGPVPVMMEFGFIGPRPVRPPGSAAVGQTPIPAFPPAPPGPTWQQQVLAKGWGYAEISPASIQPDNGAGLTEGVIGLSNQGQPRKLDDWGALRAWAWGASRALDYFESDRAVDAKEVGIEGHSRYGKAALVTMAYDQRFAIAYISSSGEGGAKLNRRNWGEVVENVAGTSEYHWMAGNFLKYAGPLQWSDLPVDAHELIALCAPRPVFISGGATKGDGWVDAKGMFMAAVAAGPVYRLLGRKGLATGEFPAMETPLIDGDLAFRQHSGGHTPAPNWPTFIAFASRYLNISAGASGAPLRDGTVSQRTPAYKNVSLPLDERARDLEQRMTLEEKVSQLGHTSDAIERLGVPEYNWWNEGLHGVARAGIATVFPQTIGMAATFDDALLHRDADAISTEFRAKYNVSRGKDGSSVWYKGLTVWSPNINIFRDPRWGRGQETYGEDPYLTSRMGVAFVGGLQGDDRRYLKVVATPKHFAVHSGPEATRHEVDVPISRHDMEDTYLPAFRATVMDGGAQSVMCAYNSVNGEPACSNRVLLREHLRDAWKFKGYVVSDCAAIEDISEHHKFKSTLEEGVAAAFEAGTDLICGEPPQDRVHLERTAALKAVHQGILPEATIDTAVTRLLAARIRLGMFDPPAMVPWSNLGTASNDTPAHRQLALNTARESLVLLRNENNLLPLKKSYARIAVIGPDADSLDALEGNYNGTPSAPVTILSGLRSRFRQSTIRYVQGSGLIGTVVKPVPSTSLYTDASRRQHGLKAEYFSNINLEGEPALRRTDTAVNFVWGFSGVDSKLVTNYSVRWTGVLSPRETGDYIVGFTGQDGYRVWIDEQPLVDDWTTHRPSTTQTKAIHLEQGKSYSIKIEYFQTVRSAEAKLVWGVPGKEEDEAVQAARESDLIVMVLGLSARVEGEEMKVHADGFSGGDRTSLDLPAPQQQLLERVSATGKPVVLVLCNGSALAVNWANDHVPAILEAWYPGEAGGMAVAEALAGDFSPSGRLPVTFYRSTAQLPPFEDYSMTNRTYRYFSGDALYPFGYGLSYTKFAYSNPRVSKESVTADESVTLSVDVRNDGSMDGDEVVQLYLTHEGIAGAASKELHGFQRVHLARGVSKTVTFNLRDRDLSIVSADGSRQIAVGPINVWMGGGQPSSGAHQHAATGVSTRFSITSEKTLPE